MTIKILLLIGIIFGVFIEKTTANNITDYQTIVQQILTASQANTQGYNRLSEMTTEFGSRLSGSQSLEDSIDWIVSTMQTEDSFDNVFTEDVFVTHVRFIFLYFNLF